MDTATRVQIQDLNTFAFHIALILLGKVCILLLAISK